MGCHLLLQVIFLTQRLKPCVLHLPHWQVDTLALSHQGSPRQPPGKNTGVDCPFLLQGIFLTQDRTWVSFIAGRFFTVWVSGGAGGSRAHPHPPKKPSNLQWQILEINYRDKTKNCQIKSYLTYYRIKPKKMKLKKKECFDLNSRLQKLLIPFTSKKNYCNAIQNNYLWPITRILNFFKYKTLWR